MNIVAKYINPLLCRWDIWLCLSMALVFTLFPNIDLWVASQFFDGKSFYLRENPIVNVVYLLFAKIHLVFFLAFLIALGWFSINKSDYAKLWRKRIRFLLLVLIIAPGILVNITLKDNSIGRARPVHVEQFGGELKFTPAFVYSGECKKNCSFTSGHAAIGFFFIAFAWILKSNSVFMLGMLVGILVGATRIVQGGHFLSDVIFSFWVVYFTCLIVAYFYRHSFVDRYVKPEDVQTA